MLILLSGFVGAIIGAGVTILLHIWKFHRDERTSRCDELCIAISNTAILAAEYWASSFADLPAQRVSEARILGGQALIDGLYADLREVFHEKDSEGIDSRLAELFPQISGGSFSESGRPVDPQRVRAAPQLASAAVIEVRRSHRRTMPLWGLFGAYHENKRRRLDMPPGF